MYLAGLIFLRAAAAFLERRQRWADSTRTKITTQFAAELGKQCNMETRWMIMLNI
jgi:hypothetical protein